MAAARRPDADTPRTRPEVITFKVEASLVEAMQGIPNRSDFIRRAILSALENTCPLCSGTGVLTPRQRQHWETFAADHSVRQCETCKEMHLVCDSSPSRPLRKLHRKR